MGMQGNGSCVSAIRGERATLGWMQRAFAKLSTSFGLLMIVIALGASVARAQSTNYVYDAEGRLVAVTPNNTPSMQYTYDTLGHLAQTTTLASGQLAIFAFIPTHGEAGTQVTIEGQGFSASPSSDSVTFNGTAATVLSASATQLLTTVPASATTGPIGVTVNGQSATSTTPFTIDDTGEPPVIAQVSPVVVPGGIVTVIGTNLAPAAGETSIQMAGIEMSSLSATSDTQLQYTIPSFAQSGHVLVQTPYGVATSSSPVTVLPSGISASNVGGSVYLAANGTPVSTGNGSAGQLATLAFDATQGQNLELTINGLTISGATTATLNVYSPNGTNVGTDVCSTTSPNGSCHISLWNLAAGTYTAILTPGASSSVMTFHCLVEPDVLGPALAMNTPTTVNLSAGELERYTFNATAGGGIALNLSNVQTAPGEYLYVNLYAPGVDNPTTAITRLNPSTTLNLTDLPATGTYMLLAYTLYGTGGTGQLTISPPVGGTVSSGGGAENYSSNIAGQDVTLNFNANQGDNLELTLYGIKISGSTGTNVTMSAYSANGTNVGSQTCAVNTTGGSCRLSLWGMVAGAYTVIVSPPDANSVMTFNALLQPDVNGPALTDGTPSAINMGIGQVNRITFNANQSDNLEFALYGLVSPGGVANSALVTIYSSSGSSLGNVTCYSSNPSGSCHISLWDLAAGTYTAIVQPANSGTSVSFNALVEPDAVGPALAMNTSATVNLAEDQSERFTFNADAGGSVALNLANVSTASGESLYVNVYAPGVDNPATAVTRLNPSSTLNLTNLPATGTYMLLAYTLYGSGGSAQLAIGAPVNGTLTTNGSAQNVSSNIAGQNVNLSFSANQGDNLELTLYGLTTTPVGNNMSANVYNSSNTNVGALSCSTSNPGDGCHVSLWNLNAGTYSIIASPSGACCVMSFNAMVSSDVQGGALTSSSPVSINLAEGQIERFTYSVSAGDTPTLSLADTSTTQGDPLYVNVYISNGTNPTATYYGRINPSSTITLPNQSAATTYTLVAYTVYSNGGTAQLSVASP